MISYSLGEIHYLCLAKLFEDCQKNKQINFNCVIEWQEIKFKNISAAYQQVTKS